MRPASYDFRRPASMLMSQRSFLAVAFSFTACGSKAAKEVCPFRKSNFTPASSPSSKESQGKN